MSNNEELCGRSATGLARAIRARRLSPVEVTEAVAAFPIGLSCPAEVEGRRIDNQLQRFPFTFPFAVTGQPAITVPCGFTAEGLPGGTADRGETVRGCRRLACGGGLRGRSALGRPAPSTRLKGARPVHRIAIALLVAMSLGCTSSLQEIRQRKPALAGDFPQPYQAISRCIYEQLNAQTGRSSIGGIPTFLYRLDDQPDQRRARIDAMSVGGSPSAEFEITVESAAAGMSRVEYRRRWDGFWSTDQAAWNVVVGCGQRQA